MILINSKQVSNYCSSTVIMSSNNFNIFNTDNPTSRHRLDNTVDMTMVIKWLFKMLTVCHFWSAPPKSCHLSIVMSY